MFLICCWLPLGVWGPTVAKGRAEPLAVSWGHARLPARGDHASKRLLHVLRLLSLKGGVGRGDSKWGKVTKSAVWFSESPCFPFKSPCTPTEAWAAVSHRAPCPPQGAWTW